MRAGKTAKPEPIPPAPATGSSTFPRSGRASTTGSLLRIRTGRGLQFPVLGLLGDSGTPIQVITQAIATRSQATMSGTRSTEVVSDRFVTFL